MSSRSAVIAAWLVAGCVAAGAQAPQGGTPGPAVAGTGVSTAKPSAATAKVAGRIVAADTGKPLRRVSVTLLAMPSKTTRVTETDASGRYEFAGVPAGRYSVRPAREGYLLITSDPFALGLPVEVGEGEVSDRIDFSLPKGSVIAGRITDEFGEPVAGVIVQAARYQFRPGGQRQLIMGSTGNYFMLAGTNDLGEFRIFGLKPGSYYLSARPETSRAIAISQTGAGSISGVETEEGLTTTYYPGTANIAEAQTVRVELMRETHASFTLTPARMARVTGTVRDSQGVPVSPGTRLALRPTEDLAEWFGIGRAVLGQNGTFAIANVPPGGYVLEIRPGSTTGNVPTSLEYADVPLTIAGEDIEGLEVVTRTGISVSGRVIFEGKSNIALPNLRISAASEQDARNVVGYTGPDGGQVAPDGQFHIPSVFGKVLFRTGFLPQTVMLKSVRLNGVDITNTPYDASGPDNIEGLEVVLVDKQSRIVGYARNARGELQYNFRLVIYPANVKPGDVGVRFQHNASPNDKGQVGIQRMPPGDYVGLAIRGVQPGEEWDPELRKRIEELGRRFTLKEDESLELDFPYVE